MMKQILEETMLKQLEAKNDETTTRGNNDETTGRQTTLKQLLEETTLKQLPWGNNVETTRWDQGMLYFRYSTSSEQRGGDTTLKQLRGKQRRNN